MLHDFPYIGEILSLSFAISWSFALILFKKAGESVPPFVLNLFKNTLGIICFIITILLFNFEMNFKNDAIDYFLLILSGIIGIGISDTLFFMSLNRIGASLIAIVDCLHSPFVILLSIIFLKESISLLQLMGAILIISGILITTKRNFAWNLATPKLLWGYLFGILSAFGMAIGDVITKPLLNNYPIHFVFTLKLFGGLITLWTILIFLKGKKRVFMPLFNRNAIYYTLPASFIGAYLALMLWGGGLKYAKASIAAILGQTSNIITFILAGLILKESIDKNKIIAILLAILGIFCITFG